MINLRAEFESYGDEYIQFEFIKNPLHPCPDVCAFLLLQKLAPLDIDNDMIVGAELDEITLAIDCKKLAETATSEDIRTLVRCGVRYDGVCLRMFV